MSSILAPFLRRWRGRFLDSIDCRITGGRDLSVSRRCRLCGTHRPARAGAGLPDETLLNVNVPNRALRSIKGVRVTCLSRRRFDNPHYRETDPHGRKYFWIAGTRVSWSRSKNADHEALEGRDGCR